MECVVTQFSLGVETTFYFTENNACFTLMGDITLCKVTDPAPPLRPGTDIILDCEAKIIGIIFTRIGLCWEITNIIKQITFIMMSVSSCFSLIQFWKRKMCLELSGYQQNQRGKKHLGLN